MNIPHSALILRPLGEEDRVGLDSLWKDSVLKTGASSAGAVVCSVVSIAVELRQHACNTGHMRTDTLSVTVLT
jgi:hypothetical protein